MNVVKIIDAVKNGNNHVDRLFRVVIAISVPPPSILASVVQATQPASTATVASDVSARLAFESAVHATRSAVIAANAALSSITVPRLSTVLESHRVRILGSHFHLEDPRKLAINVLELTPRGIDARNATHGVLQCVGESHV